MAKGYLFITAQSKLILQIVEFIGSFVQTCKTMFRCYFHAARFHLLLVNKAASSIFRNNSFFVRHGKLYAVDCEALPIIIVISTFSPTSSLKGFVLLLPQNTNRSLVMLNTEVGVIQGP